MSSAFDSVANTDRLAVIEVLCCFLAPAFVLVVLKVRHGVFVCNGFQI